MLRFSSVTIDLANQKWFKEGKEPEEGKITPRQTQVLELLLESKGKPVSIDDLTERAGTVVTKNALTQYVKALRAILGNQADSDWILTVTGGYILAKQPEKIELQDKKSIAYQLTIVFLVMLLIAAVAAFVPFTQVESEPPILSPKQLTHGQNLDIKGFFLDKDRFIYSTSTDGAFHGDLLHIKDIRSRIKSAVFLDEGDRADVLDTHPETKEILLSIKNDATKKCVIAIVKMTAILQEKVEKIWDCKDHTRFYSGSFTAGGHSVLFTDVTDNFRFEVFEYSRQWGLVDKIASEPTSPIGIYSVANTFEHLLLFTTDDGTNTRILFRNYITKARGTLIELKFKLSHYGIDKKEQKLYYLSDRKTLVVLDIVTGETVERKLDREYQYVSSFSAAANSLILSMQSSQIYDLLMFKSPFLNNLEFSDPIATIEEKALARSPRYCQDSLYYLEFSDVGATMVKVSKGKREELGVFGAAVIDYGISTDCKLIAVYEPHTIFLIDQVAQFIRRYDYLFGAIQDLAFWGDDIITTSYAKGTTVFDYQANSAYTLDAAKDASGVVNYGNGLIRFTFPHKGEYLDMILENGHQTFIRQETDCLANTSSQTAATHDGMIYSLCFDGSVGQATLKRQHRNSDKSEVVEVPGQLFSYFGFAIHSSGDALWLPVSRKSQGNLFLLNTQDLTQ